MVNHPHANLVKIESSGPESPWSSLCTHHSFYLHLLGSRQQAAAKSDFMFWVLLLDENSPTLAMGIRYRITWKYG